MATPRGNYGDTRVSYVEPKGETIDGSGSALRLEPIRPSSTGPSLGVGPGLPHSGSGRGSGNSNGLGSSSGSVHMMQREGRRSSQDEIRALLQRTSMALDKIVKIRESMEPFVDFKQFEKKPVTTRQLSRMSSGLDDVPMADGNHGRRNLADSYGSTEVSSSVSEDPLGDRSTGSTDSTSSIEEVHETARTSGIGSTHEDEKRSSHEANETSTEEHQSSRSGDGGDDDSDSTFSEVEDEMPPLKEARLDRLKNITISFHEGLPAEFFMAIARFLHSTLELKTRHSRFNFYKDTFVGNEAVRDMILSGFAEDQPMALRFGNVLVKLGFIEHVSRTDDQLHNSKENFYRFTKALEYDEGDYYSDPAVRVSINASNYRESVLTRDSAANVEYDFSEASDEVHALVTDECLEVLARVLHKTFERKNKLLYYKGFVGCFLGAEAVNVIRELRIGTSLIDAVLIGQALLDEKIIEPIATTVTTFQDKYVFYRLTRIRS